MERGSPPPDPPADEGPQAPLTPPGEAPSQASGYDGPVPPGGWEAPLAPPRSAWAGAPLATWGNRVVASLLDGLILTVPVVVLTALVVAVILAGHHIGAILLAVIFVLIYLVVWLLYAPVLMARSGRRNGQTWGKQIVGIRVIWDSGQPADFELAFIREFLVKQLLFDVVGGVLFFPPFLNVLWPLWDDENRCLHDMVVSTHVVEA